MRQSQEACCRRGTLRAALVVCAVLAAGAVHAQPKLACDTDTFTKLALPKTRIVSAAAVKDDARAGPHCAVRAAVNERTGTDGKPYAIGFEIRLPDNWNGRYFDQLNGGNDGAVVPAYGGLGGNQPDNALARGYAVLSSDSGHDGQANRDAGLVGGTCSASTSRPASTTATPRTSRSRRSRKPSSSATTAAGPSIRTWSAARTAAGTRWSARRGSRASSTASSRAIRLQPAASRAPTCVGHPELPADGRQPQARVLARRHEDRRERRARAMRRTRRREGRHRRCARERARRRSTSTSSRAGGGTRASVSRRNKSRRSSARSRAQRGRRGGGCTRRGRSTRAWAVTTGAVGSSRARYRASKGLPLIAVLGAGSLRRSSRRRRPRSPARGRG